MSFSNLLSLYIESLEIDSSKIPNEELGFYKYISKKYLYIDKNPSLAILKFYEDASRDIKAIQKNITHCKTVIATLEAKKQGDKDEDHEYIIRLHNYYIELNNNGEQQIIDFISSDKIKDYSIFDCLSDDLGCGGRV